MDCSCNCNFSSNLPWDKISKISLIVINFVYIIAAIILIFVGYQAMKANIAETLPVVGGIIACGAFLLFVAFLGLGSTFTKNQVLLSSYVIILGVIFTLQFFISTACLGVTKDREVRLVELAWNSNDPSDEIHITEISYKCCGLDEDDPRRNASEWKQGINGSYICPEPETNKTNWCNEINYCMEPSNGIGCHQPTPLSKNVTNIDYGCPTCLEAIENEIDKAFHTTGIVGLVFSYFELFGIIVAFVFGNQCK